MSVRGRPYYLAKSIAISRIDLILGNMSLLVNRTIHHAPLAVVGKRLFLACSVGLLGDIPPFTGISSVAVPGRAGQL